MKKLLLIASFVVLGSSLVASENNNNDNNNNERLKNVMQSVPKNSKQIMIDLIKENPIKTTLTTLGVGFFLAVPFISMRVKTTLGAGIIIGAGTMLKALDAATYNDFKGEVKNFYTNTISPKCTEVKEKIETFYNENIAKKD